MQKKGSNIISKGSKPKFRWLAVPMFGLLCLLIGLCLGVAFAPQLKMTPPGQLLISIVHKAPLHKSMGQNSENSPIEIYDYPTIKWHAKPIAEPEGAIGQLWTTYEYTDDAHKTGKMNYRLTLFKAGDKRQCVVQLLDDNGFKITEFTVSEFHKVPGAEDIIEARDSSTCTESEYKRVGDYSID